MAIPKNKPTLIIPAAGKSSRFPGMRPKWLLTHPHGKLMIEEVLSSFDYDAFSRVIIIVLREHCAKFQADLIINQAFGNKIEICILEKPTSSSPETVVKCVEKLEITGPIIVKDSDCLVDFELPETTDFVVGADVHELKISNLTSKSFILKDDDNIVQSIVEKKVISSTVCLGVYGIESSVLLEIFHHFRSQHINTELYFSHIISHLISNGTVVLSVDASRYFDWGTAEEWNKYAQSLRTYILDIDGVFLKNTGKYGSKNWGNTCEPIEENMEVLAKLSQENAEIVFLTSRTEEFLTKFRELLDERGIKFKGIISGCNHNRRILVNDFAPSNPYPSCEAINIPRNSNLGDYL